MLNPVAVASAATPPEASSAPGVRTTTAASTEAPAGGATKLITTANPSYVLDLGLGLVVLQYHNQNGDVTSSIPSERQLQAYRDGGSPVGDASGKT